MRPARSHADAPAAARRDEWPSVCTVNVVRRRPEEEDEEEEKHEQVGEDEHSFWASVWELGGVLPPGCDTHS